MSQDTILEQVADEFNVQCKIDRVPATQEELEIFLNNNYLSLMELKEEVWVRYQTLFPKTTPLKELVNHPDHYGGKDNPYEAIKVIEAWRLGFNLGNAVKYISRVGKKDAVVQELGKIKWYVRRYMENLGTGIIMTPKLPESIVDQYDVDLVIEAWELNSNMGMILRFIYNVRFHGNDDLLLNETLELIDKEIKKYEK